MSVNSKMTALADEIRELSGTTDTMGLDAMAHVLNTENTNFQSNLTVQDDLIAQIQAVVDGLPEAGGSSSVNYNVCTVELDFVGQCTIDNLSYIALVEGTPTILYFNGQNCPLRFENVLCNSPFIISFANSLLTPPSCELGERLWGRQAPYQSSLFRVSEIPNSIMTISAIND